MNTSAIQIVGYFLYQWYGFALSFLRFFFDKESALLCKSPALCGKIRAGKLNFAHKKAGTLLNLCLLSCYFQLYGTIFFILSIAI